MTLSTGVDFSSGDYGLSADTDILYVPVSLKLQRGPLIAKLTVPYLRIKGPGSVVGGTEGAVIVGGGKRRRVTHSGLGDIVLRGTYVLRPPSKSFPYLELTGKIKFPTADENLGLGTGEFDYTLQLEAYKRFGRFLPFASVAYRWVGDPPGTNLHNKALASVGIGYRVSKRLQTGLIYDWSQTASRRTGDSHELVPYFSWRLGRHLRIGPYAVIGLSRAAPDYGAGFQIHLTR